MLLFQTLLGLLRRSAGKIVESIFGWAVAALFGEVRKEEKTLLSATVAAVAFWPVLLAGIAFPKVAAFVLALVPLPKSTPEGFLRIVWAALALLVPFGVGLVLQRREGSWKWGVRQTLAGFPLTIGLSTAFVLAFVAMPLQKLSALMRGEREEHVTLIVEDASLDEVSGAIREALDADGLAVEPARPPWVPRTISAVMRRTAALVGKATSPPRFYRGPDLQLTLYPHGSTVRGLPRAAARAHAVIAGVATRTVALQTTDPEAQKLERRIKELWPRAGKRRKPSPHGALPSELARALSRLNCSYEDWEIVYRQCLQLSLADEGIEDPVAESGGARFERDARERRRSGGLARRARGMTGEKAGSSAAKMIGRLAQKVAESVLSPRRSR